MEFMWKWRVLEEGMHYKGVILCICRQWETMGTIETSIQCLSIQVTTDGTSSHQPTHNSKDFLLECMGVVH